VTAGVYRIRNRITGEVYIGSTVSLYTRIRAHVWALERGTHINRRLRAAWQEYGRAAFGFSILERTERSNAALVEAEARWMGRLTSAVPGFYNRLPAAQGRRRPLREIVVV
jgi:group I intron endonuclease